MKRISILLAVLLSGCSVIGPGERGVRISFGQVSTETLSPGLYFWVPVMHGIKKLSVRIQKSEVTTNAASKDMQDVHTVFALNWHLSPNDVGILYSRVGDEESALSNIIIPALSEVLKRSEEHTSELQSH